MGSFCYSFCLASCPNLIRLAAFILYYISAFSNAMTLDQQSDNPDLNNDCSNDYDVEFVNKRNGNLAFGFFIVSFFFNFAILIINGFGFFKLCSTQDSSAYFSHGALFGFLSVLFWVPGNFASRVDYSGDCIFVEGIMVHFFNRHGFGFIVASWSILLFTIFFIIVAGCLSCKFNMPIIAALGLYSLLYYVLSLIIIIWCTLGFQLPWIIIFILELIFGMVKFFRWVNESEVEVKNSKVIVVFIAVFIKLKQ